MMASLAHELAAILGGFEGKKAAFMIPGNSAGVCDMQKRPTCYCTEGAGYEPACSLSNLCIILCVVARFGLS